MNKGYIVIFHTLLFMAILVSLLVGVINPVISHYASAQSAMSSKKSLLLADSAAEEALYRLKKNKLIGATQNITLSQGTATITVANTTSGKRVEIASQSGAYQKNYRINLALGTGIAFHYGIQSGNGGFSMLNSSSITGNVFSTGPIVGTGNTITGEAISAGSSGLIYGVRVTGSAYARTIGSTIRSTTIDKDAYYINKVGTVNVAGVQYPNSPDQPEAPLPISDAQIAQWESDAAVNTMSSSVCDTYSSSTNTCTFTSSKTIGPVKIPFNLVIKSSSAVITINGPVWVTGDITTQTGPTIRMHPNLGSSNVAIIADNPADRINSSKISVGQSTVFQGSGSQNSFVFMISQNSSAENGGSVEAISMSQGASALVAYASHGLISLSQSVSVKEATGYKIELSQSANVTYDTGLPNVLFSAGPGGGYNILDWTEL